VSTAFRPARPEDARAIAGLHADSWQRHDRGAYADAFLDSDASGYLLALWTERMSAEATWGRAPPRSGLPPA
jgi:hypothetical protein